VCERNTHNKRVGRKWRDTVGAVTSSEVHAGATVCVCYTECRCEGRALPAQRIGRPTTAAIRAHTALPRYCVMCAVLRLIKRYRPCNSPGSAPASTSTCVGGLFLVDGESGGGDLLIFIIRRARTSTQTKFFDQQKRRRGSYSFVYRGDMKQHKSQFFNFLWD
jgi:hypothetical protein